MSRPAPDDGPFGASDPGATTTEPAGPPPDPATDDDRLLDLLERWEEGYRAGADPSPESLYGAGHPLLERIRSLIVRQKRLYARLGLVETPADGDGGAEPPPPTFPGHEVLGEIGRGGMGVVYRARDPELGRYVAIKTIAAGQYAAPDQRERFRSEAQAVARLRHPNIIAIHAIGEHDGRPYLSLELAEGGSLAHRLAEKPMAPREAAELLETLARAVNAAHQAGVVHRDLKPSNILLTAEGVPKVSDFGLAKLLGSDSGRTLSGQPIGTPSYMAPEQAEGRSKHAGPAADVYALGAILYQALTGRPPFLGESALETLKLVVSTEVVAPHLLRPDIPRDLETICLKCLEKEPAKRYAGALALAEDLRRFLDGRPIAARPIGPSGRLWRWGRRNPGMAALSAAVLFILIAATAVSTTLAYRATRAEATTRAQRNRAELARNRAFGAINTLVLTDKDQMLSEELRPYRELLIDEGLRLATETVAESEDDPREQQAHAEALMAQAKLLAEKGEHGRAYEAGMEAVRLMDGLIAREPAGTHDRAGLAGLLHQFSLIADDRDAQRTALERSNEIYRALLRDQPRSDQASLWVRMVSLNLYNIGHGYHQEWWETKGPGRGEPLRKAIAAFREGERLCEPLVEEVGRDRAAVEALATLAVNKKYLCRAYRSLAAECKDVAEERANIEEAIACGEQAVSLLRSVAERNPENYQFSMELHDAQRELGNLHNDRGRPGDFAAAIPHYSEARKTLGAMAERHGKLVSRMAQIRGVLALTDYNLSNAYANADLVRYYDGPRRAIIVEIYEICDKLSLVQPLSRDLRKVYAHSCLEMPEYQSLDGERPDIALAVKAERLWDGLHRESLKNREASGMLVIARRALADMLEERGRADEASHWLRRSRESASGDAGLFYDLATNYAMNAGLVGKLPGQLGPRQRETWRRRLVEHGVAMLREAVAEGFRDVGRLRAEAQLDPLRSNPGFQIIALDLAFPADPWASKE